jgi:hypothetical protein
MTWARSMAQNQVSRTRDRSAGTRRKETEGGQRTRDEETTVGNKKRTEMISLMFSQPEAI